MKELGTYERDEGEALPRGMFARLYRYRYALANLVLKDFRVRYRNMSLGFLWSLINPLVMLGVLIIVFSFIHPNRHAHFFPVFLLSGMITYNFFTLCLPPVTNSIMDNASLVKKVIFPRELIPISVVLSNSIHLVIQLILLMAFVLLFKVPLHATILLVPVVFMVEVLFILGMAFACSALSVFYRDMLYIVQSALSVMFWLTPIFYDLAQVKLNLPKPLYYLYLLNPIAGLIDAVRNTLLRGKLPDPESFGIACGVSVAVFIVGVLIFRKRQAYFADKI